tara:strand:+ start:229 stop:639 length:411 start_codon:yes stop_codon:yes gene_type:complete
MAGILKVDDLRGNTAAGDITITSEGGAATQSLQQGLAKAWSNYDGSGTVSVTDSLNVSSLSDGGVGDFTHTFVSSMANGTYTLGGACHDDAGNFGLFTTIKSAGLATGTCKTYIMNHANSVRDPDIGTFAIHGDLA